MHKCISRINLSIHGHRRRNPYKEKYKNWLYIISLRNASKYVLNPYSVLSTNHFLPRYGIAYNRLIVNKIYELFVSSNFTFLFSFLLFFSLFEDTLGILILVLYLVYSSLRIFHNIDTHMHVYCRRIQFRQDFRYKNDATNFFSYSNTYLYFLNPL